MTAPESRPGVVTAAFWLLIVGAVLLMTGGLLAAAVGFDTLRQAAGPSVSDQSIRDYLRLYRGAGVLFALAAAALALLVLLAVVLRDWRATLRVVLPLTMSIVLVMAGLVLLGRPLNLLHLVGMLLVVAVGSNYALFFNQRFESVQALNGVVAPLLLANLSTVIGFGVLALSSVPVLNAMGVVVAPGAVLALLLSLVFARPPVALTE